MAMGSKSMNRSLVRAITSITAMSLLLSVLTTAHGQQTTARIKIDIDRTIGEVHPHLFGNFTEHLGRMIYGGIYEEGSPLSDKNGYRKDVLEAVKQLNVSILRWARREFRLGL
jgi:alpha-L-arabinofuranosidase